MKPHAVTGLAVLLVALSTAPAASGGAASSVKRCGSIGFTPNSDDIASHIRAEGLTCGLARDFIRDSEGRPGARFRGFRCASTPVDGQTLSYDRFRCTGAGDVIRWRRY